MLGIVPAAGSASRLQPLSGSKELLPLGHSGSGRLRVVSDYLVQRMLLAGADRICLVISADKPDLLRYWGQLQLAARVFFLVQPQPLGLCDAVFRAAPFVEPGERVLIGLPDTVWYPELAFRFGLRDSPHLITFPAARPEVFDAVIPAPGSCVARVEVKAPGSAQRRVWGAITSPGRDFLALKQLWRQRRCQDHYLGHLFNAWIAGGGQLSYDDQGTNYWDIGTPAGYERALADQVWDAVRWSRPQAQPGESQAEAPGAG
ncbi:MAG: sugar phosphate nucleotidyltransferase [Terriglobales bacterium]